MSDDKKITDPNDPRLLAELKKQRAAAAAAKKKQDQEHNMGGGKRWAGGSPIDVTKNLVTAANKAKVEHGVVTPRNPFITAWDAAKGVWNRELAKQNLADWSQSAESAQANYESAVKDWTSNPTEETYKAWQDAGHALHTNHVALVQAETELHDSTHAVTPDQTKHVGFDFSKSGTGNLTKVTRTTAGTAYTLKDGSVVVFDKNGNQYSVDKNKHVVGAFDKSGNTISAPKSVTNLTPAGSKSGTGTANTKVVSPSGSNTAPTVTGGTGSTGSTPNPPKAVKKTKEELLGEYGVQMAVINSDKSLSDLFNKAVKEQMPATAFQAALRNTDFYQKHGASYAQAYSKELGDPGDWTAQTTNAQNIINQEAVSLGMSLTHDEVTKLAHSALYMAGGTASGITQSWLDTHIAAYGKVTGKGGKTFDIIDNLKQQGASMGIAHDDSWYTTAAKNIVAAKGTENDYISQIRDLAKTKYSWAADQIDNGMTVKQIASPYVNSMANILEIPQDSLSLNDPTINKALTNIDQTGKQTAVPLWQFETNLRQDPRWATTKNAKDTLDSTAHSILQNFGLAW